MSPPTRCLIALALLQCCVAQGDWNLAFEGEEPAADAEGDLVATSMVEPTAEHGAPQMATVETAKAPTAQLTLADLLSARGDSFAVRDGQIVQVQGEPSREPVAPTGPLEAPGGGSSPDPTASQVQNPPAAAGAKPVKFPPLMQFQDDSFYVSGEIFAGMDEELRDIPYLEPVLRVGTYPRWYPMRDAERALCSVFSEVGGPRAGRVRIHADMQQAPPSEMWRLWNALGVTWRCEGFARRAVICLLQAIRLQRQAGDTGVGVRFNLAMVLQHAGLLEEAHSVLEAVINDTLPADGGERSPANQRVYVVALCELEVRLQREEPGRTCIDRFEMDNPSGKKAAFNTAGHHLFMDIPTFSKRLGMMFKRAAGPSDGPPDEATEAQQSELLVEVMSKRREQLMEMEEADLRHELEDLRVTGLENCEDKACLLEILDVQGIEAMAARVHTVRGMPPAQFKELARILVSGGFGRPGVVGNVPIPTPQTVKYVPMGETLGGAGGETQPAAGEETQPLLGQLYADEFYQPPPGSEVQPSADGEASQGGSLVFEGNGRVGGRNMLDGIRNSYQRPMYENLEVEKGVCQVFARDGGVESARRILAENLVKLGVNSPQSWDLWNGLGNSWRCEGHAFRALQCFLKAEALLGRPDASVAVNMASVLRHQGYIEDARRLIEASLSKSPEQMALASHMWCDITVALAVAGREDLRMADRCLRDLPGRMPGLEDEVKELRRRLSRVRPWFRSEVVLLFGCFTVGAIAFAIVVAHLHGRRSGSRGRCGNHDDGQRQAKRRGKHKQS